MLFLPYRQHLLRLPYFWVSCIEVCICTQKAQKVLVVQCGRMNVQSIRYSLTYKKVSSHPFPHRHTEKEGIGFIQDLPV